MVHVYFEVFRVIYIGIGAFLVVGFAWQLYLDRIALEKLFFRSPRRYKTHRVFRVAIFLGGICTVVAGVDFYGAHNIYSPYTRVTWLVIASLFVPSVLGVAIINELRAAFALVTIHDELAKVITYASASTGPVCGFTVLAALYIDNRGYYVFSKVIYSLSLVVGACVANYVYWILRRHFKNMVKLNMSFAKTFWTDLLGRWRLYTVALTVVCFLLLGSHIFQAIDPANANVSLDNVNFDIDYDVVPTSYQITSAVSNVATLMLLGWRSWIGKKARKKLSQESKKLSNPSSGSDVDTKKPLSGTANHSRIRAVSGVSDIQVVMQHQSAFAGSRSQIGSQIEMSSIDSTSECTGGGSLPDTSTPRNSPLFSSQSPRSTKPLVSFSPIPDRDMVGSVHDGEEFTGDDREEETKSNSPSEMSLNKADVIKDSEPFEESNPPSPLGGKRSSVHFQTGPASMV